MWREAPLASARRPRTFLKPTLAALKCFDGVVFNPDATKVHPDGLEFFVQLAHGLLGGGRTGTRPRPGTCPGRPRPMGCSARSSTGPQAPAKKASLRKTRASEKARLTSASTSGRRRTGRRSDPSACRASPLRRSSSTASAAVSTRSAPRWRLVRATPAAMPYPGWATGFSRLASKPHAETPWTLRRREHA